MVIGLRMLLPKISRRVGWSGKVSEGRELSFYLPVRWPAEILINRVESC